MTTSTFSELHAAIPTLREASGGPRMREVPAKPCRSSAAALGQTIAPLIRTLLPGLVALAVSGLVGCRKAVPVDAEIQPDPTGAPAAAAPREAAPAAAVQPLPAQLAPAASGGHAAQSPGSTVMASSGAVTLEVGDQRVQVTIADGRAIKAALLARLRASSLEDRDYLIRATQQVEPSIDGSVLRIGVWILESDGARIRISYRMPAGPEGAQAYRAEVVKSGQTWDVKEIIAGHIRARH